jgi:hypothetical protein
MKLPPLVGLLAVVGLWPALMKPGITTSEVNVAVVDSQGRPIKDASVRLVTNGNTFFDGRTDSNGQLVFEAEEGFEDCAIFVKAPSYVPLKMEMEIQADERQTIVLSEAGSVTVIFPEHDGGHVYAGLYCQADSNWERFFPWYSTGKSQGTLPANGVAEFRFGDLPEGTYRVAIFRARFEVIAETDSFQIAAPGKLQVEELAVVAELKKFSLFNLKVPTPFQEDVRLFVRNRNGFGRSDFKGQWEFDGKVLAVSGLPFFEVPIGVVAEGFGEATFSLSRSSDRTGELVLSEYSARSIMVSGPNGEPLGGLAIAYSGFGGIGVVSPWKFLSVKGWTEFNVPEGRDVFLQLLNEERTLSTLIVPWECIEFGGKDECRIRLPFSDSSISTVQIRVNEPSPSRVNGRSPRLGSIRLTTKEGIVLLWKEFTVGLAFDISFPGVPDFLEIEVGGKLTRINAGALGNSDQFLIGLPSLQ